MIPLADQIACVSEATEKDLHTVIPATKGRTTIIHNGFNSTFENLPHSVVESKLSGLRIPDKGPILLHVGGNAWYKNRIGALKILHVYMMQHSNPNAHLVLVGPDLDEDQTAYAEKHKLMPHIQTTGPLEHTQLEALYCKAKALLFPSRYEGFGWPPLEAQKCGCPIVTSKNGSLEEVVGKSAPTAEWDDTPSHVKALNRILEDPVYRKN